jgi:hypothetical protein
MKRYLGLGLILVFTAACLSANAFRKLSPAEQTYLERAMAQPLTFMVKSEDTQRLWGVAQAFIGKHASMKIENVSEFIIETYNPYGTRFGYRVVRTPKKEGDEFSITCLYDNTFSKNDADQNAHIFAHYLMTEEIVERLIQR